MAEYIKREEALRAVQGQRGPCRSPAQNRMLDYLRAAIMRVPATDVAEVVRCKDCKYNIGTKKCLNPDSFFAMPKDDDFCSYGERREAGR